MGKPLRSTRANIKANGGIGGIVPCFHPKTGTFFFVRGEVGSYHHMDWQPETSDDWQKVTRIANGNPSDPKWPEHIIFVQTRNGTWVTACMFTFPHAPIIYAKAFFINGHCCIHFYFTFDENKNPGSPNQYLRARNACIAGEKLALPASTQTAQPSQTPQATVNYQVQINTAKDPLTIRSGPGTNHSNIGSVARSSIQRIVRESDGSGARRWGQLPSGGWISLDHTIRVNDAPAALPTPAQPSQPVQSSPLAGTSVLEKVWKLMECADSGIKGISDRPEHIAGILGNLVSEAGEGLCPFQQQVSNGAGLGLMQWTAARRAALEAFMWSNGISQSEFNAERDKHLKSYCNNAAAHPAEFLDRVLAIQVRFMFYEMSATWERFYLTFVDYPTQKTGVAGARAYAELFCALAERPGSGSGADSNIQDNGVQKALRESDFVGGKGQLNRISFSALAKRRSQAEAIFNRSTTPKPPPVQQPAAEKWDVQCEASRDATYIDGKVAQLKELGYPGAYRNVSESGFHQARVPAGTEAQARALFPTLRGQGFPEAFPIQSK